MKEVASLFLSHRKENWHLGYEGVMGVSRVFNPLFRKSLDLLIGFGLCGGDEVGLAYPVSPGMSVG